MSRRSESQCLYESTACSRTANGAHDVLVCGPIRSRRSGRGVGELAADKRELVRVANGVQVVDESVACLELQHADELLIAEREYAGIAVDGLGHERDSCLGSEEPQQVG